MSKRLGGKRALVLGAAPHNVGAAIAKRYIEEGAKVVVAGRRPDATAQVAKEIGAHPLTCDITNSDQVAAVVADAAAQLGGLDIGVNATGWGLLKPFLDNTRADLDAMCAIQFTGPFQFYQALVRAMQESGGSIINISSVTATIMMDNHAAYMGTKAGMEHVIRTIANEFGPKIRANTIAPGGVADTPMSGGGLHAPAVWKLYEREIPMGRPGVAADVADVALWLASDEAKFITGQTLHVSGGQTLRRNPSLSEIYGAFQTPQT
jgi:NAD(P)-dependent dehydrogenase (short-subunit alcohol dehydrogenase family)